MKSIFMLFSFSQLTYTKFGKQSYSTSSSPSNNLNYELFEENISINFDSNGVWATENACTIYSFSLYPGIYKIEAWGASGGGRIKNESAPGGYSSGNLTLNRTTKLFAVAGSAGYTDNGYMKNVPGGCNGGGDATTDDNSDYHYSSGGGASHVAAIKNELAYRILVAGGAGGSISYYSGRSFSSKSHQSERTPQFVWGGYGGGIEGGSGLLFYFNSSSGKGATQTGPGDMCDYGENLSSCSPGSFGTGGSPNQSGSGGGGGWFGGSSSNGGSSAGGGSGFVFNGNRSTGCQEIDEHPLHEIIKPLDDAHTEQGTNKGLHYENGSIKITVVELFTIEPSPSYSNSPSISNSPVKFSNESLRNNGKGVGAATAAVAFWTSRYN